MLVLYFHELRLAFFIAVFPRAETRIFHRCGPVLAAAAGNTARQSQGLTRDVRGLQRSQQSKAPPRQTILLRVIMIGKVC
jgi:hypothetical protein